MTTCDELSLREALAQGGTIQYECDGTVLLSAELLVEKDAVIDSNGHKVILSGDHAVRVLHVKPDVNLTLLSVVIAHGKSNRGGGLLNEGGKVTVSNCVLTGNLAVGNPGSNSFIAPPTNVTDCVPGAPGGIGEGGAVYSTGRFAAVDTFFLENTAQGGVGDTAGLVTPATSGAPPFTVSGGRGGDAAGGAVRQASGTLDLLRCTFRMNRALGGDGGADVRLQFPLKLCGAGEGGTAQGGCVDLVAGEMNWTLCFAEGNTAHGGMGGEDVSGVLMFGPAGALLGDVNPAGGSGGAAQGTVLFNAGKALVRDCSFRRNEARGGNGGAGGSGNPCVPEFCLPLVTSGIGGHGGASRGAAVYNAGELRIEGTTMSENEVVGGLGGLGGISTGGNQATGTKPGPGGTGGGAEGGTVYNRSQALLLNCTLVENRASAGSGGTGGAGGVFSATMANAGQDGAQGGGGGQALGGALANDDGSISLINCTVVSNRCLQGQGGSGGAGGLGKMPGCPDYICYDGRMGSPGKDGVALGGGLRHQSGTHISLVNTLLAFNQAGLESANASGLLDDGGYNLSTDESCHWTSPDSQIQADPKLGLFGDHGGSTPTIPLLPNSPARDHGSTRLGPTTDQRGVLRPFGAASDIGAFEYEEPGEPGRLRLAVAGDHLTLSWKEGPGIRLQRTRSLAPAVWQDIPDTEGKHEAILPRNEPASFFRLIVP